MEHTPAVKRKSTGRNRSLSPSTKYAIRSPRGKNIVNNDIQGLVVPPLSTSPPLSVSSQQSSPQNNQLLERILEVISNIEGWTKETYTQLAAESYENSGTLVGITLHKWQKMISMYYIDVLCMDPNNTASKEKRNSTLLWQACEKFNLEEDRVKSVALYCSKLRYELISIEHACRHIPVSIRNKLTNMAGIEEFINLGLRYYILCVSDGLFLSIDNKMYTSLANSSSLPVIECYASPFNYNIKTYCSLFHEDEVFGALPRFDKFIDMIDFPCRLCINPPYTPAAIELCINKTLSYMDRQRGEFIALIPRMFNFEPLERLLAYKNTRSILLVHGTYVLHSFFCGSDIIAPMDLYLVVNVGRSADKSQAMVNDIVYHMRYKACSSLMAH